MSYRARRRDIGWGGGSGSDWWTLLPPVRNVGGSARGAAHAARTAATAHPSTVL
jgi:hypothetical protein